MPSSPPISISSPYFNIREICKQMCLLEDHLNHSNKRCPDCIIKHFLSIEAYLEEGVSLSQDPRLSKFLSHVSSLMRQLEQSWVNRSDPERVAGEVRLIRKKMAPMCMGGSASPLSRAADLGSFAPPGRNILLDILVAGAGLYVGYFLVERLGTGATS